MQQCISRRVSPNGSCRPGLPTRPFVTCTLDGPGLYYPYPPPPPSPPEPPRDVRAGCPDLNARGESGRTQTDKLSLQSAAMLRGAWRGKAAGARGAQHARAGHRASLEGQLQTSTRVRTTTSQTYSASFYCAASKENCSRREISWATDFSNVPKIKVPCLVRIEYL